MRPVTREPVFRTEREVTNVGVMAVRADDEADLLRRAVLELDAHPRIAGIQRAHGVAEHDLHVVGDGAVQNAHQVVAHDLDLAVPAHLMQGRSATS